LLGQRVSQVRGGDGTEQVVLLTDLAGELERHIVKLLGQLLSGSLLSGGLAHGRGLHLLDDGLVALVGLDGQLARQKEIAAVALGDFYHISARAQLLDIFFQDDFHCADSKLLLVQHRACARSHSRDGCATRVMLLSARGERQQGDVAGLLDGRRDATLVRRADAGQAAGHDLALLRHELAEQAHVFVIDGINLLDAELADLLAAEELASAFTAATGTALRASAGTGTAGTFAALIATTAAALVSTAGAFATFAGAC